ncbi:Suppressor of the cold-sensitive snRNP biogenesis mutant brr1-1 [Pestalotiopsis sp. IQ-011]
MDDESIKQAIFDRYMRENLECFTECMLRADGPIAGDGPGPAQFLIEMQRRKIEQSSSEPIRLLRVAAWRAREFHDNELADRARYLERAQKCFARQRELETAGSQPCRKMAALCAEEGRECEERAALSRDLARRAMDRGYELEELQMSHEFRDFKHRQRRQREREGSGGGSGEDTPLDRLDPDLQDLYEWQLIHEEEDAAEANLANQELEERCVVRDEQKTESSRLFNMEKDAQQDGQEQ